MIDPMPENPVEPAPALLKMRRVPRQARSRMVVDSLREACERILVDDGDDVITSHRIAELAGVDIASLYRYFPNKEGIIAQVYESRLIEANAASHLEAMSNIDPHDGEIEEKLHGLVGRIADQHESMLDLHSGFYREYFNDFDLSRRRRPGRSSSWREELSNWLAAMLIRGPMTGRRLDAETTAFLAFRVLYGVLDSAVLESPDYVRDPGFREQLSTAAIQSLYS
ncbi:MAG: hypothetical protein CL908_03450 [Deltaproteobacteria bacterium]|jgi:AcrR family transcriptional regulator|nr:hypothetical protein [Deltaproteobacteria bacterium]